MLICCALRNFADNAVKQIPVHYSIIGANSVLFKYLQHDTADFTLTA
jgi:hypothetical protein